MEVGTVMEALLFSIPRLLRYPRVHNVSPIPQQDSAGLLSK